MCTFGLEVSCDEAVMKEVGGIHVSEVVGED